MSDDKLRGKTVLVVGEDASSSSPLGEALARRGALRVIHAPEPEAALLEVARARPDVVLVAGLMEPALREYVDPLGLDLGPPLVAVSPLDDEGAVVERLATALDLRDLRGRVSDLEGAMGAMAVEGRRARDSAEHAAFVRLSLVADFRDDNTHEHTERVAHLAALLGARLGLAPRTVALIRVAATLHDIGKVAIPDSILLKPDHLSPEEYEVVKTHALVGARILAGGETDLVKAAESIARSHHERWDGTGYPDGLAGDAIPLPGRLVALADVFDVLVHERPYKEEWTPQEAAEEIRRVSGTQFDPGVVEAFDALGPRAWTSSPYGSRIETSSSGGLS